MRILKCAGAGAVFGASGVVSASVTWTLVQNRKDQRRRLEEAEAARPAPVVPGQRPEEHQVIIAAVRS